jgi:hypothetical protein
LIRRNSKVLGWGIKLFIELEWRLPMVGSWLFWLQGLSTPGHLRLIKGFKVRPVLAQQSIRELNLTGRNYPEVLADVVWAVFQEDYQVGFGADGDHLKTFEDIKMALNCGFTLLRIYP